MTDDVFKTGRKTMYQGVEMRSRLEAGFAAWLDAEKLSWEYEPTAFAGPRGQYLPDFRVLDVLSVPTGERQTAYIEVKPRPLDIRPVDYPGNGNGWDVGRPVSEQVRPNLTALGRRMSVIWDTEPEAILLVVWPRLSWKGFPSVLRMARLVEPMGQDVGVFFDHLLLTSYGGMALGQPLRAANVPWPDGYWTVQ